MAAILQGSMTPAEIGFLCEMESVTIIPRQRLDSIPLLGGATPSLRPPHRSTLPLWLALLLKRQRRCSIVPPPWLSTAALESIIQQEIGPSNNNTSQTTNALSSQAPAASNSSGSQLPSFTPTTPLPRQASAPTPPFQPSSTAPTTSVTSGDEPTLPYHWLELSHLLLTHASDDIPDSGTLTRQIRDLREVRQAKLRAVTGKLNPGAGIDVSGIGAMELAEGRAFLTGAVDGLRKLGASREVARREEAEERGGVGGGGADDDDEDIEM